MVSLAKYQRLVDAVRRHGDRLGVVVKVEHVPERSEYPFVMTYVPRVEGKAGGLLFLFPPHDIMLASEEISYIVKHIRSAGVDPQHCCMLFSKQSLEQVKNVLDVSGLGQHATTATYEKVEAGYLMDWQLPPETGGPA